MRSQHTGNKNIHGANIQRAAKLALDHYHTHFRCVQSNICENFDSVKY